MKLTVTRTQTQITLDNKEVGFLREILSAATQDRVNRPVYWLLRDPRVTTLYEQLSAITGNMLYNDDAAELSEFYEDAKEKTRKAMSAVRHSRNQSRMTVELKRATKQSRPRRRR